VPKTSRQSDGPRVLAVANVGDLCPRGQLDLAARREILHAWKTKSKRIIIPQAPGSRAFWAWYVTMIRRLRPGTPELTLAEADEPAPAYQFSRPVVLAYSGGAESQLIITTWPSLDRYTIADTRVEGGIFTHPVEGALAIIGAGLGYSTTFFGHEIELDEKVNDPDEEIHKFFESEDEFNRRWLRYSGAQFLSPVRAMTKVEITRRLLDAGIKFYPCLHVKDGWCGTCAKCVETYYIHHMLGREPPFKKMDCHSE
jgi:hypothetical protein